MKTKVTLKAQIKDSYLAREHRSEQIAAHPGSHYCDLLVLIIWGLAKDVFLITFFATIQCCGKSVNAYALQSLISFSYTRRYFTNEQSAMLRVTQIFVHSASQVVGVQLVGRGRGES